MAQAMCGPILGVWDDGNVRVFGARLPMIGFPPEVTIRLSVGLHVVLRCIGAEVVGINLLSAANDEPKKAPETGAGRRRESVMFWQLSHGSLRRTWVGWEGRR